MFYAVCPDCKEGVVVADGEHSSAGLRGVRHDHVDQRSGGGGVQHGGHLVADQVPRSEYEGASDASSLQLTVTDFVGSTTE